MIDLLKKSSSPTFELCCVFTHQEVGMATAPFNIFFTATNVFTPRGREGQLPVRGSRRRRCSAMAREQEEEEESEGAREPTVLRHEARQPTARSRNMSREYGGQWLSSVTRHVRIYAAYIDPAEKVFDQTQMDKLTLLLDPTNEFVWTPETCHKVYAYFQDLVDHYEGADLTEYTLRLIGSDVEHYIRKLLYQGEIKYNMDARVLNFSMGKPRVVFNTQQQQQSPP